jgi:diadenosine tetraphosphatase ApaH/serine/threonine PP2A family protein phosphatase
MSDIHGNLAALESVLADIQDQGIDEIYCLGDVVGYGPNPCECIDKVREHCTVCLLGHHDHAVLFGPEGFGVGAEQSVYWTREILESSDSEDRIHFLCELPRIITEPRRTFVHASPRNPLHEYVFPYDIQNLPKMEKIFARCEKDCFYGHTHIPGIITEDLRFLAPEDVNSEYQLNGQKHLINVGSVGQPRDGNPDACYVILDGVCVRFRRVAYDIEATARQVYDIPQLINFTGDRLFEGT